MNIDNILNIFSSFDKRKKKLEGKLRKSILSQNHTKEIQFFSELFHLLVDSNNYYLLSDLITNYNFKTEHIKEYESRLTRTSIKSTLEFLSKGKYYQSAAKISKNFNFIDEYIELLSVLGNQNDIIIIISQKNILNKKILINVVDNWEKYNGSIKNNPILSDIFKKISFNNPDFIPNLPQVKEVISNYAEAAELYLKNGQKKEAAHCLYLDKDFDKALKIYEEIGDRERISKIAEQTGDYLKALNNSSDIKQKIRLNINLFNYTAALDLAKTIPDSEIEIQNIRNNALIMMNNIIEKNDFIKAIEILEFVNGDNEKKSEIINLARKYYTDRISSAESKQNLDKIVKEKIDFEVKIKNYVEAAILAEDVLKDLELASLLYEKANLFNQAIEKVNDQYSFDLNNNKVKLRLAELNEKGGNLVRAAKLYEQIDMYEKASKLYENLNNYSKSIECYLQSPNIQKVKLIELYALAGEYEKAIDIYIRDGSLSDLESALMLATNFSNLKYIKFINEEIAKLTKGNEDDLKILFEKSKLEIQNNYSKIIGIDFGTTNSVVGVFNKKTKKVEIVPAADGNNYEPSFFGVNENKHPIFGGSARMRSHLYPNDVVACIKRELGKGVTKIVGGKEYKIEEIVARIIQKLKLNAEDYFRFKTENLFRNFINENNFTITEKVVKEFLKKQEIPFQIKEVVLTVPAYFNDNQKRATKDAAEIAGFTIKRLLHEPTAAALSYGYQKEYNGDIAVIDLGGGTLDISILDVGEGVYDVKSIGGDTRLGGRDMDIELLKYFIKDIEVKTGIKINEKSHPNEISRLIDSCEQMKINLSTASSFDIELLHFMNISNYVMSLNREELEKISAPILTRLREKIKETIRSYNQNISNYLLVGNATKMPAVTKIVENELNAIQLKGIDPGTVVATGAGIFGGFLSGDIEKSILLDIVPYSLGISTKAENSDSLTMSRLVSKNTQIPVEKTDNYSTTYDFQTEVRISIYQGESPEPGNNYFLGSFVLDKIMPAPKGRPKIEVTFKIDSNCILTVTALDADTRNKRSIRIEGAVSLSYTEKEKLTKYFSSSDNAFKLDNEISELKNNVDKLISYCENEISKSDNLIKSFMDLFHEKIEINAKLYKAKNEHVQIIQKMYLKKEELFYGIPAYKDRFKIISKNYFNLVDSKIDFSNEESYNQISENIKFYKNIENDITKLIEDIETNLTGLLNEWIIVLQSIEPDQKSMNPVNIAKFYLVNGRLNEAKKFLEERLSKDEDFSKEEINLLLESYLKMGLRDEYFSTSKKYSSIFGLSFPDFNKLNQFLKSVESSIFLLHTTNNNGQTCTGSGFVISHNLIATNRHVVENCSSSNIKIFGKDKIFYPRLIEVDPTNDIAVLKTDEDLNYFKVGEFNFIEPGEEVIAIGFPSPESLNHKDNIYISKGIVNSIRLTEYSNERVIFVDAKIGGGMSGGPLINELGEVVGILSLIRYHFGESEKGIFTTEQQPVALPISLFRKYIQKYKKI